MSGGNGETAAGENLDSLVQVEVLVQSALKHGLLKDRNVTQIMVSLKESGASPNPRSFCRTAVQLELITRFQAKVLLSRDPEALSIGPYLLVDKLGQGGMGSVYRARHKSMERVVALKVLRRREELSAEMLKRFKREILAAAKLTHPNIVTAFDAGEQRGIHYLVMEYVSGDDLQSRLKREGPLSVADAVACVKQVAVGMQYAHNQQVVHRDIKPGNLLLTPEGQIKILDLGLAKLLSEQTLDRAVASELTADGTLMGTVDYLSPEQSLDTKLADARSDVYSLGCTLYTLLAGQPVYPTGTVVQKILAHRDGPIPCLRDIRPDVPEALDDLLQEMLAKSPADRPQTMDHVAERLRALQVAERLADTVPQLTDTGQLGQELVDTRTAAAVETLAGSGAELLQSAKNAGASATLSSTSRRVARRRRSNGAWWLTAGALLLGGLVLWGMSTSGWVAEKPSPTTARVILIFQPNDFEDIAGAEIWIDQQLRGRVQQIRQAFDLPGDSVSHEIEVRRAGYESFVHNVSANASTVTELPIQLRKSVTTPITPLDGMAESSLVPAATEPQPIGNSDSTRVEDASARLPDNALAGQTDQIANTTEESARPVNAPSEPIPNGEPAAVATTSDPSGPQTLVVGIGPGKITDLTTAIQQAKPYDTILIEHQGPLELSPLDLTGKTPLTIAGGTQGGQDFWPIIRQRAYSDDALNRVLALDDNTAQPMFSGDQLELSFKKLHLSCGGFGREKLTSLFRCNGGKIRFDQCTVTASSDEATRFSEGVDLPLVELTGAATQHLDLQFVSTLFRGGRLRSMVRIAADASVSIEGQQLLWAGGQGSVIEVGYGASQARVNLQESTLYNFASLLEIPPDRLLRNNQDRVLDLRLTRSILMGRDRGKSRLVTIEGDGTQSVETERWRKLLKLVAESSIAANIDEWLPGRAAPSTLAELLTYFQLEKGAISGTSPRFRVLPAGVELQEVHPRDLEMRIEQPVKGKREAATIAGARAASLPPALPQVAERILVTNTVAAKPRPPRQVIEVSKRNGPIHTLEEAFGLIQAEDVEIILTDSEIYSPGRNFDLDNKSAVLYSEVARNLTLRAAENQSPVIVISDSPNLQLGNVPKLSHWDGHGPQLFLFQIRALSWHMDGIRFTTNINRELAHAVFLTSARYVRMTNCSIEDASSSGTAFFTRHNGYGIVSPIGDDIASEKTIKGPLLAWVENVEVDHFFPPVEGPSEGLGTLPTLFSFSSNRGQSAHFIFRNCQAKANQTLLLNQWMEAWVEIEGCSIWGRLVSTTGPLKSVRIHENLMFSLPNPVWTDPPGLTDSISVRGEGNALWPWMGNMPGPQAIPPTVRNQGALRWIGGPALTRRPELDDKFQIKRPQAGTTMAEDGGPVGFRPERVAR